MRQQWRVGIFLYEEVDVLDVAGPFEVLSLTGYTQKHVARILDGTDCQEDHPFIVRTVSETGEAVKAHNGLRIVPDYGFADAPHFDILVIPGGAALTVKRMMDNSTVIDWIGEQMKQVQLMTSVCTGSFLLAKAGLLAGKQVTTHRFGQDALALLNPDLQIVPDQKVVDQGNLITSGGISAGIEMALHVVGRLLGREAAVTTARSLEYDGYHPVVPAASYSQERLSWNRAIRQLVRLFRLYLYERAQKRIQR
ncbi:DJ-1/PfpI family protein [Brevibacillus humidisoli]|uniref:DJ-1/PfpI family protein n=1 Tax=Brevibacillus humidisoli TaxID=2895522 RepID=UPI0030B9D734